MILSDDPDCLGMGRQAGEIPSKSEIRARRLLEKKKGNAEPIMVKKELLKKKNLSLQAASEW